MIGTLAHQAEADITVIEALLKRFRQQKAELSAIEQALASTRAALENALGQQSVCRIAGLGEVRRIAAHESVRWDTNKLKVVHAALLLMGEDKIAADIEGARTMCVRKAYLQVTLDGSGEDLTS